MEMFVYAYIFMCFNKLVFFYFILNNDKNRILPVFFGESYYGKYKKKKIQV